MTFVEPKDIQRVALIGLGTVGASWAALMLARGLSIQGHDPAPGAETRAKALIQSAWPSLRQLGVALTDEPPLSKLVFCPSIEAAVASADLVQENTPEHPDAKREVMRRIDAAADPSVIILSSTGGITPSTLQEYCRHPERLIVFHPFNPTHLIPLVEVVPGAATLEAVTRWAMDFAAYLGKKPIRLNTEITGHMTNRLQFALVREAVRCLMQGIATPQDVDAAVRYGLAPRWMLMGGLHTLHLAGGHGGMKAILDHAGAAMESWWEPGDTVRLTDEVKARLIDAGAELSGGNGIPHWMNWRDHELVGLLRAQDDAAHRQPVKPANGRG